MSTIITKNSANSGSVPASLVQGELAINVTDGRLFYGSGSSNNVKEFGVTASYALNALSASYAISASYEINYETSSSYAETASYVNPLTQSVDITGSLNVNNTFYVTSSNSGIGVTTFFSGSTNVSHSLDIGSFNQGGHNLSVRGYTSIGSIRSNGYGAIGSNYYLDNAGTLRNRFNDAVSIIEFPAGGFRFLTRTNTSPNTSIISTLTELMLVTSAGLVGIGINSPSSRLHVRGSGATSATTALRVENTNASASMVVLDNGFVGINTGSAQFNLDVDGTARIRPQGTTTAAVYFQSHGFYVNRSRLVVGATDGANSNSGFQIFAVTSTGKTYLEGWNDGGSNQYDIVIGNQGSRTQFGVDSTSVASAQVAINSTTKGFLPPRTNLTSNISTPAQGLITYVTASTTEGLYYYNSGSTPGWRQIADTTFVSASLSGSAGYLPVFTGANSVTSSVVFQSGSNIGIGTSTPAHTLDVNGNGKFNTTLKVGSSALSAGVTTETEGVFRAWTSLQIGQFGNLTINQTSLSKQATGADFFEFRNTGTLTPTAGTYYHLQATSSFAPTSGTAIFNGLNLNFIVNQTGGANGITRGLFINPTLTSAADFRAIETVSGNVLLNTTSGNTGIGLTSPSARLHVRGSGTTSATIGLRVENSNASASLIVNDAGDVYNNGAGGVTSNTFYGENAGRSASGAQNTAIGNFAAQNLSTGARNTIIGQSCGVNVTTGGANVFMGWGAGSRNIGGGSNVIIGDAAGRFFGSGSSDLTTVNTSIIIGADSRANANSETNQIVIGYQAIGLGSNTSVIGNTSTTLFRPYGNVAINRNSATASLDVAGTARISGSFNTATSGSILTVIGSGSAQPLFTVQGSQGELFSVTDSLSGSLFSVNDISGLPILEVFSDNTTLMGSYLDPMLITTTKVTQTNSGSFVVYSLPTASYDTAFFEYSIKSGSNARAGTIMAIQAGSTVNFTETTTTDIGDTTAVSFTVLVTGSNIALTGSSTSGAWVTKCIIRGV